MRCGTWCNSHAIDEWLQLTSQLRLPGQLLLDVCLGGVTLFSHTPKPHVQLQLAWYLKSLVGASELAAGLMEPCNGGAAPCKCVLGWPGSTLNKEVGGWHTTWLLRCLPPTLVCEVLPGLAVRRDAMAG